MVIGSNSVLGRIAKIDKYHLHSLHRYSARIKELEYYNVDKHIKSGDDVFILYRHVVNFSQ